MVNPEVILSAPRHPGLPPFVQMVRHQSLRRMNCCARANRAALESLTSRCMVVLCEESWPLGLLVEVTIPLPSAEEEQCARCVTVVGSIERTQRLSRREALTLQGPRALVKPALRVSVTFLTTDEELTHWVGERACADSRPPRSGTEHPDLRVL